jgi:hypothetical protein
MWETIDVGRVHEALPIVVRSISGVHLCGPSSIEVSEAGSWHLTMSLSLQTCLQLTR